MLSLSVRWQQPVSKAEWFTRREGAVQCGRLYTCVSVAGLTLCPPQVRGLRQFSVLGYLFHLLHPRPASPQPKAAQPTIPRPGNMAAVSAHVYACNMSTYMYGERHRFIA